MTPKQKYEEDLAKRGFSRDAAQARVVAYTEEIFANIVAQPAKKPGVLDRLLNRKTKPVTGLYLWGGVGRGKTYLIDSFYDCLPLAEKQRMHFNEFMKFVHGALKELPKSPDPLQVIGQQLAQNTRVLCLDEFHVDDITDAMILGGLLDAMFANGITLVTTSNIRVDDLYLNGLQRERFLPAIALLKEHTTILKMDDGVDYRMELLEKHGTYHITENSAETHALLMSEFRKIAPEQITENQRIEINRRSINVRAISGDVAWFNFDELCNTPRSSSDYIELASSFHTVFVSGIYEMHDGKNDIAQRFIQLIDALYDHHVKLVIGATRPAQMLYHGNALAFPFQRTTSRLHEMRSPEYLSLPHKG